MSEKVPTVIIVRYSNVAKPGSSQFETAKAELDDYLAALYHPTRMRTRETLFRSLALPSIAAQNPDRSWFRLIVVTSELLPEQHRKNLDNMLRPYDWAEVVTTHPFEPRTPNPFHRMRELLSSIGATEPFPYLTLRLDDDDGLSYGFLDRIQRYATHANVEHIITLAGGYIGRFDEEAGRFTAFCEYHSPHGSAGMAQVGLWDPKTGRAAATPDVFSAGGHREIARRFPYIVDDTGFFYLRSLSLSQDSVVTAARDFDAALPATAAQVCECVAVSSEVLPMEVAKESDQMIV